MLNEISCWYVNWNAVGAVGAWVGGLATASAAFWAVYVAVKAWHEEKRRRRVKVRSLVVLMIPEMANTLAAATSLNGSRDGILSDHFSLAYVRSRLSEKASRDLLGTNGEIDEKLALAAAEFVATSTVLQDSLERWGAGGVRSDEAKEAIRNVAALTADKVRNLAEAIARHDEGNKSIVFAAIGKK